MALSKWTKAGMFQVSKKCCNSSENPEKVILGGDACLQVVLQVLGDERVAPALLGRQHLVMIYPSFLLSSPFAAK